MLMRPDAPMLLAVAMVTYVYTNVTQCSNAIGCNNVLHTVVGKVYTVYQYNNSIGTIRSLTMS